MTVAAERDDVEGAEAAGAPEPGRARFAGRRSTPPRTAPDDDSASERPPPERMVLVPIVSVPDAGGEQAGARLCVLVRMRDSGRASLLELPRPAAGETLDGVVADVLRARLGVRPVGEPRLAPGRVAVRLPRERRGSWELGWMRAVAVDVEGEPVGDALVDEVVVLRCEEAVRALRTDTERRLLMLAQPAPA